MFMPEKNPNFEILVIDDDKVVSLLHKNLLRFDHIQPAVLFRNGKKALEYLNRKNCAENCFLLLLDLHMPIINGWKFLKQLEKSTFDCTVFVVLVTSSISRKDQIHALEFEHVIDFCEKPLLKEHIAKIQALEEVKYFFKQKKKIPQAIEL